MKIEPLRSYKPKDFALLTPGHKCLYVETTWGKQRFSGIRDVSNALLKLQGFTCYVPAGLERLKQTTNAREWVLTTWKHKAVKMTHVPSGVTVTSLRGTLEGSDDPFRDLNKTLEWLRGYGIPPASISSMAWKLLRASLGSEVSVAADPEITRASFFGGRQEISKPGVYEKMRAWDIKAAYPTAMASRDFALSLRKVDNTTELDPTQAGLARAKVYVPRDLPYPPLPVRITDEAIQFQWGELEGTWAWVELNAAKSLGCQVEVIENYAPGRTMDLFTNWWDMGQEGRNLSGASSNMAKAVVNSMWGQFAMNGTNKQEISWADNKGEEPFETPLPNRSMPHRFGVHIASEVTARVRTQTLLEGIYGMTTRPVHIDTDGIIVSSETQALKNVGKDYGQWRVKEDLRLMELKAPQLYRYLRPDNPERWYYVASGLTYHAAREVFERNREPSEISYLSLNDVVLPSGDSDNEVFLELLLQEARSLGVE